MTLDTIEEEIKQIAHDYLFNDLTLNQVNAKLYGLQTAAYLKGFVLEYSFAEKLQGCLMYRVGQINYGNVVYLTAVSDGVAE